MKSSGYFQSKAKTKYRFIPKPLTSTDRLNEIASLLGVAIRRLHLRKERLNRENSLDSKTLQSVTPAACRAN
jgi:hypothetical protein